MNKRDEIREGLEKIAYRYTCTIEADEFLTDEVLNYLHSQGVAICKQGEMMYGKGEFWYLMEPLIEEVR